MATNLLSSGRPICKGLHFSPGNLVGFSRPQRLCKLSTTRSLRPLASTSPAGSEIKFVRQTVSPDPSYSIPLTLLGLTGFSAFEGWLPAAAITGILGAFLAIQASRVKFVFDDEALEVVIAGAEDKETENAFVGGKNRWKYTTFVNWEFWWPNFPVLVYFKETQTKPEGQIHFFPIIFNGRQLYDVMVERCGSSQNSGPAKVEQDE